MVFHGDAAFPCRRQQYPQRCHVPDAYGKGVGRTVTNVPIEMRGQTRGYRLVDKDAQCLHFAPQIGTLADPLSTSFFGGHLRSFVPPPLDV